MTVRMFDGQEVEPMRTYVVTVCSNCRRQADPCELRCSCADVVADAEPVEIPAVALDDPRIIVTPDLARTAIRS